MIYIYIQPYLMRSKYKFYKGFDNTKVLSIIAQNYVIANDIFIIKHWADKISKNN